VTPSDLTNDRMAEILSRVVPHPFSVGSKSIVTDESVTRDDADEGDAGATQGDVDLNAFAESVANLKTTVIKL